MILSMQNDPVLHSNVNYSVSIFGSELVLFVIFLSMMPKYNVLYKKTLNIVIVSLS